VDEVPSLQGSLLAFDEQQALAREDEEVLLRALAVIQARGLPGLEDADVDPELLELGLAFEDCPRAELLVLDPSRLFREDDAPDLAFRDEAGFRLLQGCFRNHLD
jgi:hypothetical protein